jgi:NAD(P)-dependent dehydrogenase (short-subunit alcohol dehydrogenase family)
VEEIGRNVTPVQADSGDLAALDHLAETVRRGHGRVDVLYASAGYGGGGQALGEVTVEAYDKVFGVNVRGTLFTAQTLLPLMGEGASIILNGSGGSVKGLPGLSLYSASEEIGNAVLFLASSDASFVTGTAMYVDGGYTQV